ncbi:MAG: DUF4760 domain-containing protein [Rhodobacteraceae bacterium]|nr:DUF4760 domain-containing protein [Paracoccaceae bacterium]
MLHSRVLIASVGIAAVMAFPAYAQELISPASAPGFSFDQAKDIAGPALTTVAWVIWAAVGVWNYVMAHGPAAIMLSALIAYIVARRGIISQREMTRLRETFSTIDDSIRDHDVIASRIAFKNIKLELKKSKESIAKFHHPTNQEYVEKATTLRTILNDYENLALGIRYSILDEEYLHRWTRTTLIDDWNELMPLVTAYRSSGSQNAYIEFEGLATCWDRGRSYKTGKSIKTPNKHTEIR